MTDRLDTIRKRLASGNPFTPNAGDLAWALDEIERLTATLGEVDMILGIVGADREFRRVMLCTNRDRMKGLAAENTRLASQLRLVDGARNELRRELDGVARAEIARLDALSRATADDPEDVVPCLPCGRVECACGSAADEEQCA